MGFADADVQGKFDNSSVRSALDFFCARAGQISNNSRQRATSMAVNFEEPLKEFARTIKCVQAAMADRAAALSAFCQVGCCSLAGHELACQAVEHMSDTCKWASSFELGCLLEGPAKQPSILRTVLSLILCAALCGAGQE